MSLILIVIDESRNCRRYSWPFANNILYIQTQFSKTLKRLCDAKENDALRIFSPISPFI